ncbi:shikimate dehydrogenase [Patescibacteria group bacterium]|nr:shikimate dehydrogenase [Patescibacteria group bacterium]
MTRIDGNTKIVCFFGTTYKTSKMYAVYNAAFAALDLNYIYIPVEVTDLKAALEGIRTLGIKAVGVTIPYKVETVQFLDELSPEAKLIGAVNTVINSDGVLTGYNTDGQGAVKALKEVTTLKNKNALLIGAGGAGRAIVFALVREGTNLTVLNRNKEKAANLAKAAGCQSGGLNDLAKTIKTTDIIINATTLGMFPNVNNSAIPKKLLRPGMIIQELVSNPEETKLIKDAKESGCKIVTAKSMLLWQAVFKFKLYTGEEPPVKIMEEAIKKA